MKCVPVLHCTTHQCFYCLVEKRLIDQIVHAMHLIVVYKKSSNLDHMACNVTSAVGRAYEMYISSPASPDHWITFLHLALFLRTASSQSRMFSHLFSIISISNGGHHLWSSPFLGLQHRVQSLQGIGIVNEGLDYD